MDLRDDLEQIDSKIFHKTYEAISYGIYKIAFNDVYEKMPDASNYYLMHDCIFDFSNEF